MPRQKSPYSQGGNPNSKKNLELGKKYRFKPGDRQGKSENGKLGAEKRNENIIIRKIIEAAVQKAYKNEETGAEEYPLIAGVAKMVDRFRKTGNISDFETISEHLGQKPAQKVEQLVITPEVDYDKLKDLRKALKDDE